MSDEELLQLPKDGKCLLTVALLWVCLLTTTSLSAQPVRLGAQFQVNTWVADDQFNGRIGIAPDGRFAVAWGSRNQTGDGFWHAFGQRYDAQGNRRGAEFEISGTPVRTEIAHLGMDAAGAFTVVWSADDGHLAGIFARRYDDDGNAGAPFLVNTYTQSEDTFMDIAVHPDGRAVVVWRCNRASDPNGIVGRRLGPDGTPVGSEFQVNSYTPNSQSMPKVAMDASGAFVVVWDDFGTDGSSIGVFGRRFDAQADPLGADFQVNQYTTSYQATPDVALDAGGRFLVVWVSRQDGSDRGIMARHYDASGSSTGPEFLVNTYTTGHQVGPHVTSDGPDRFVTVWSDEGRVVAKRFEGELAREPEFVVSNPAFSAYVAAVAADGSGDFNVAFSSPDANFSGVFGQRFLEGDLLDTRLEVDAPANGVLESGEEVTVAPAWRNRTDAPIGFTGAAVGIGGPGNASNYEITDGAADYSVVPAGAEGACSVTANCYRIRIGTDPRPQTHWDAFTDELLATGETKRWLLHVGESFSDVPRTNPFYRFVETLLHRGVTGGCGTATYCPTASTSRDQMAVFVLVGREGPGYTPQACGTPVFDDVSASSPFCRWIEELARRNVVAGCGGGNYCPSSPVTREQMPVFVLRTLDPTLDPPGCTTPMFADVPATSPFCRWIEELARRSVVSGCGGGNYCPSSPVTREQMGVFIAVTFALTLYGP